MESYKLENLTPRQAQILVRIVTCEIEQQEEWAKKEFADGSISFGQRHMSAKEEMQKVLDALTAQGLKPYVKCE